MTTNNKKQKLPEFEYKMKLKAAIIGAVFYLLLSTQTAFKIMGIIFNNSLNLDLNNFFTISPLFSHFIKF
jgi:hypothetical protein